MKQYTLNIKALFIAMLIVLVPIIYAITIYYNITFLTYYDELIALIFGGYIVLVYARKKMQNIDQHILECLVFIIIIGVISNLFSGLVRNWMIIFVDALGLCKVFFCYLAIKYSLKNQYIRKKVISYIYLLSKISIIIMFFCGSINLLVDIGMSNGSRYGIPSYSFIFKNPARCGIVAGCCLDIVLMHRQTRKNRIYEVMAILTMLYTTKGMAIIIAVTYLVFPVLLKNKNKIKLWHIILLGLLGVFFLNYQIETYLLNSSAPRSIMLLYGFITGWKYFPLGSGFATYGSEMAARYYSQLYIQYGFMGIPSLSDYSLGLLNDNYMGMVVAQFGFFGLILHIYILYLMYKEINNKKTNNYKAKYISLGLLFCLMAIFIASGTFKSQIGAFMFMILGLYASDTNSDGLKM